MTLKRTSGRRGEAFKDMCPINTVRVCARLCLGSKPIGEFLHSSPHSIQRGTLRILAPAKTETVTFWTIFFSS